VTLRAVLVCVLVAAALGAGAYWLATSSSGEPVAPVRHSSPVKKSKPPVGQLGNHRFSLSSRLGELAVPGTVSHLRAYVALAAGAFWLGRQALRGRPRLALGASLLILTSPWILPWYATWPVALASLEEDGAGQVVALGRAAYLLPARIPL
jgi:hypothetical protein